MTPEDGAPIGGGPDDGADPPSRPSPARATRKSSGAAEAPPSNPRTRTGRVAEPPASAPEPASPPPPPAPGRPEPVMRTKTGLFGRLAAVAVLILAGLVAQAVAGGGGSDPSASGIDPVSLDTGSGATPDVAGPTCPPATESTNQALSQISSVYIPAPAGFAQAPDNQGNAGPINAGQLSSGAANPPLVQDALTTDGYEVGFRRLWDDPADGLELHILLLKFSCAAGAEDDASANSGPSMLGTTPSAPLAVTGIPNGWGATATAADQHGAFEQVIIGSSGDFEIRVFLFSAQQHDGTRISQLAQSQFMRLPPT